MIPLIGFALLVGGIVLLFFVGLVRRRQLTRLPVGVVRCPECGEPSANPPTLSLLGFVGTRCRACGHRYRRPLPSGLRFFYGALGLLVLVSVLRGRFSVLAALYLVIVVVAFALDWQAIRERNRIEGR